MKINTKRTIFLVLIIINCIIIFMFSNQIADDSSVTSSRVVEFVSEIIPVIKNMEEPNKTILKEEILTPIVRKTAHFSIYTMLGIFTINFASTFKNNKKYQIPIYSLLFCMFYAITDEFHQLFIQGRSAELRDVLIDSLGALTGIAIVLIITKIYRKIKEGRQNKKSRIIKMSEKVDILLATYNGEKYLKEQIESILNQTYKNIQIFISDDCSTDGTKKILKEYEKNDKIKVFYQEKNLGYVKNFEFLLKQVESNLYMLSDQDDVWKKEKIEKTVEKLQKENLDLVFGDLEVVDEKLNTIYKSYNNYMHLTHKIEKYCKDYRLQYLYNCMTGCTILSKKEWINEILPLPTNSKYMIHDYWMGLIIALNGKVGYLKEPYILYRQHGKNQVGTKKASKTANKLEEVRNLSLNTRVGTFETYVMHEEIFNEKIRKQNKQALEYFKMLQTKKNFNFKKWEIFFKLYKYETFLQFMKNFMVLNLPFIVKIVFDFTHRK